MRKEGKLYTVNKWNKPLFMPEENLFVGEGYTYGLDNSSTQSSLMQNIMSFMNTQQGSNSIGSNFSIGKGEGIGKLTEFGGRTGGNSIGSGGSGGGSGMGWAAAGQAAMTAGMEAMGKVGVSEEFKRGLWDRADPVHYLAKGKESEVGNALGDMGVSVTKSSLQNGNWQGALVGAGLKIIGGLTNAAFGIKENKELKEAADRSIAANKNFVSNADTFDAIKGPASKTSTNVYEGGWFSGGKAADKNAALARDMANAYSWADKSMSNNVFNIASDQISDQLRNFSAYGGPIDTLGNNDNMSAINYGFMSDYLAAKKKQSDSKNTMTNLFAGTPSTLFAIGGDMQTNGADFSSGAIHVNAGGSHELNPYDGVQMGVDSEGTPNLVEEGEVVYDDYVYSDRITLDEEAKKKFHFPKKKDITYAEATKKLEKEIAERVNDPISQAGFKSQMETLANEQERQKTEMEAARAREAFEALSPEEQTAIMQRAAQEEAMVQQQAMAQEQAAMQQSSPEEAAMMQQQQMQADGSEAMVGAEPQMNCFGGKINKFDEGGKKNAGTWKKGTSAENWNRYTRNGLKDFLQSVNDKLAKAKNDEEKNQIREDAIKTVRGIQQAYSEAYQNNLTPSEMNEKVTALQKAFEKAGGNAYFDDIAENINLPKGHNTADTKEKGWVDGLWGPRTSIRNWGSTEYGDDYDDIRALAQQAGMTYAPGQFKYGDNTLYELGMAQPDVAAEPEEGLIEGTDYMIEPQDKTPAVDFNEDAGKDDFVEVDENGNPRGVAPDLKNEKLRYAGLFGPAVGLGLMAAGVGKPDYSGIDAAIAAGSGPAYLADYQPLGDYLTYRPMDIWYEQNRLNANARATDRAIMNSGANQGAKNAALLASGYNDQLASGDLYRKALEYNDALRERVATFNRGTNQFNADAYNRNSQFNAEARNRAKQYAASLGMQGAAQKLDADAGWYNSLYGNISGLFKGISDIGKENAQHNMIARMGANGLYGTATPDTPVFDGYLKWQEEQKKQGTKAKGGKNRKKHDIIL